ncbi:hypothetical protein APHAL10511_007465 [Amanita phalloides]|nr:hypothetical protein APHAL10511_007465 [Amanita phalloides]
MVNEAQLAALDILKDKQHIQKLIERLQRLELVSVNWLIGSERSQERVSNVTALNFETDSSKLVDIGCHESFVIPCPNIIQNVLSQAPGEDQQFKPIEYKILNGAHPIILVRKFQNVIPKGQRDEFLRKWDNLQAASIAPGGHEGNARSDTAALHLGIWRRYQESPHISKDTTKWKSTDAKQAMECFLWYIQRKLAPKIAHFTELYAPSQWELQIR